MKYSITTDDKDFWGYFSDLEGLEGDNYFLQNNKACYQILIKGIQPEGYFLSLIKSKIKGFPGIVCINIIDYCNKIIGTYRIYSIQTFTCQKFNSSNCTYDILLSTSDFDKVLPNTMKFWDIWRNGKPLRKKKWRSMTLADKLSWLDIVRIYNCYNYDTKRQKSDISNVTIILNGTNITDYPSFFCEIGEAINGPGGYFGASLDGLADCLCGNFGLIPPFTINWKNSNYSIQYLTYENWKKALHILNYKESEQPEMMESRSSLFEEIMQIFQERGVAIVLD